MKYRCCFQRIMGREDYQCPRAAVKFFLYKESPEMGPRCYCYLHSYYGKLSNEISDQDYESLLVIFQ